MLVRLWNNVYRSSVLDLDGPVCLMEGWIGFKICEIINPTRTKSFTRSSSPLLLTEQKFSPYLAVWHLTKHKTLTQNCVNMLAHHLWGWPIIKAVYTLIRLISRVCWDATYRNRKWRSWPGNSATGCLKWHFRLAAYMWAINSASEWCRMRHASTATMSSTPNYRPLTVFNYCYHGYISKLGNHTSYDIFCIFTVMDITNFGRIGNSTLK